MTDGGAYMTRVVASHNEDDVSEVCGVCGTEHSPMSYTVVSLAVQKSMSRIRNYTNKFVCSRDCLMACLTTHMIEQEALGRCRID